MIDINLLRAEKGGNPELVRESQRKRNASVELVDEVIALDREWVKLRFQVDELNKEQNSLKKEIGALMKSKQNADELISKKSNLSLKQEALNIETNLKEEELRGKLILIGNVVHTSVQVGNDEANNKIIRKWPVEDPEKLKNILSHDQVMQRLDAYDPERGNKIAGHRGYFLKNVGVRLNQALINYAIDFLSKENYDILQTPFFMNKDVMAKTAQLEEFDESLYKVVGDDDKYLIATSEQPISAYHMNEWFEKPEEQLPLKYCGISTCFRKEAGAHGRDTWGIFRVHQFEKVEQFCLTEPEKSWDMFEKMINISEEFYKSLEIPFRVVEIVSGALNNAASKKYDLEAWFPNFQAYKELVSCSNCSDYQSRRLEIRCGMKKANEKEKRYVHCLNSTLCATERALCCLVENYQTEEGLRIPTVLIPYMGTDFVPYKMELKKKK